MKKVTWDNSIVEPIIKRVCDCKGCSKCTDHSGATLQKVLLGTKSLNDPLLNNHIFCKTFGQFKCEECKEWRCKKCITVWICRYCKRI